MLTRWLKHIVSLSKSSSSERDWLPLSSLKRKVAAGGGEVVALFGTIGSHKGLWSLGREKYAVSFSSSSRFHQSGTPGRQKCAQSVVPYLVSRHTASSRWADMCCTSRVSNVVDFLLQDFNPCTFANLFMFVSCLVSLFAGCNTTLGSNPFKHFASENQS